MLVHMSVCEYTNEWVCEQVCVCARVSAVKGSHMECFLGKEIELNFEM